MRICRAVKDSMLNAATDICSLCVLWTCNALSSKVTHCLIHPTLVGIDSLDYLVEFVKQRSRCSCPLPRYVQYNEFDYCVYHHYAGALTFRYHYSIAPILQEDNLQHGTMFNLHDT